MHRMVEKNFHGWNNLIGWYRASTANLRENGQDLEENSSSVFKCWEWRREITPKLLRYSGRMKSEEVEPTMKIIWNWSWKSVWLMKFVLTSNFKKDLRIAPRNLKSQVRSWEKTCGLGRTEKKHCWKGLFEWEMMHRNGWKTRMRWPPPINSWLSPHSNISIVPVLHLSVQHPFPTVFYFSGP